MSDVEKNETEEVANDRREFVKAAGKLALLAPPAMTFLLSTSMSSDAIAASGGAPHPQGGGEGGGNGGGRNRERGGFGRQWSVRGHDH